MSNNISTEIASILMAVLQPEDPNFIFSEDTRLFGSMPEFDSMSVVAVLMMLEEHYGFHIEDDEVKGTIFTTVGALADFVESKLAV